MSDSLKSKKDTHFVGVKGLSDAANEFLRRFGKSPQKLSVTEIPNERTIRYYLAKGLIPPAVERHGQAAVFGTLHLLSLVLIKKLQADGLPINVIRALISNKSVEELEKLYGEEIHVLTNESALNEYRRQTGHANDDEVKVWDGSDIVDYTKEAPKEDDAKKFLESILFERGKESTMRPALRCLMNRSTPTQPSSDWRRYEILPGLELHAALSFQAPNGEVERRKLRSLINEVVHNLSKKTQ